MRRRNTFSLSEVSPWMGSGRGVRIAVIDSGINAFHSHVRKVEAGIGVHCREGGIFFAADWSDALGHGTAIAGILRAKAPDAALYSVKIFHRSLDAPAEAAAAGIRWAVDRGAQIINCSLSTADAAHRQIFQDACDYAAAHGSCLVAASDGPARELLPASLPGVIAVAGDESCAWDEYSCGASPDAPFLAHPHPRPLPGRPQAKNLRGASFAAAHVAAWAACIHEQAPTANAAEICRILRANARPSPALQETQRQPSACSGESGQP